MPGQQPSPDRLIQLPVVSDSNGSIEGADFASHDSAFLVCRKLRSKLAFAAVESSEGEHVSALDALNSTAVFWCLSTMECAGPDGGFAHQSVCRSDRGCYQARG